MNIRRNKTIDITTVFLSCCLCVAPMLQAVDTAATSGSAVANSLLLPTGNACKTIGTLQQPQVQASTPPQVVYLIPQQPAPQPVPTRSFGTSVGNFICENPKLVFTLATATASTIAIAANAWRTGALERLVRRNHTDVTNRLGQVQATAEETQRAVEQLQQTVGENHTVVTNRLDGLRTTATATQEAVEAARAEAGRQHHGFASALRRNARQLSTINNQQNNLLRMAQKAERSQRDTIAVANRAMLEVGFLRSKMDEEAQKNQNRFDNLDNKIDKLTRLVEGGLNSMTRGSSSSVLPLQLGSNLAATHAQPTKTLTRGVDLTPAVDEVG